MQGGLGVENQSETERVVQDEFVREDLSGSAPEVESDDEMVTVTIEELAKVSGAWAGIAHVVSEGDPHALTKMVIVLAQAVMILSGNSLPVFDEACMAALEEFQLATGEAEEDDAAPVG